MPCRKFMQFLAREILRDDALDAMCDEQRERVISKKPTRTTNSANAKRICNVVARIIWEKMPHTAALARQLNELETRIINVIIFTLHNNIFKATFLYDYYNFCNIVVWLENYEFLKLSFRKENKAILIRYMYV